MLRSTACDMDRNYSGTPLLQTNLSVLISGGVSFNSGVRRICCSREIRKCPHLRGVHIDEGFHCILYSPCRVASAISI